MNDYIYLFTQAYVNAQGRSYLRRNAYNKIYSGNSFNVCLYLTTAEIADGSHWWQMGITFIKRLDLKVVLPHRCQVPRLMIKTPPQSIMLTWSEHVVCLRNALFLLLTRTVHWTLTSHSSALNIGLQEYIYNKIILISIKRAKMYLN